MKKKTIDHTDLLVLSLLAGEDMYGYQIITELEKRSEKVFEMKEGTLYPVLHGLWKDGAVESYEKAAPSGRTRKYYHITQKGRGLLKEEAREWRTYRQAVEAVLSTCPAVG